MTYLIEAEGLVKPEVELVGRDGNAWAIMGRIMKAWKHLGRPDIAAEFQARAMSGNYDNLLAVAMQYCEEPDPEEDDLEEEEEYDEAHFTLPAQDE